MRTHGPADFLLALATEVLARATRAHTPAPRPDAGLAPVTLSEPERIKAGRILRVNHAGEVAAQALYHGQSLGARTDATRAALLRAGREEGDHLDWTRARLDELDTRASLLDPLWYAGALAIGAGVSILGDAWSFGFIAETEHQVMVHLDGQITKLPPGDTHSRAILARMREDEARHATHAHEAGGRALPAPVRQLMRLASRVMVETAYWL